MQRFIRIIFLLGIFAASRIESRTYEKDLDDLEDLRKLVSSSKLNLKGWDSETDPCGDTVPCGINHLVECNWEGVACIVEGGPVYRIAGIEIQGRSSSQRLEGRLPAQLPLRLRSISLPDNALRGNLFDPRCVGADYHCSDIWWRNEELTKINMNGNELEGPLPEWQTLKRLESIQLANNRINSTLPRIWSNKIHLSTIDLSGNQLAGMLPDSWGSLVAVQFIRLARNHIYDRVPEAWFDLPSLLLLDLSGNCGICGEVPRLEGFAVYGNGTNLNRDCSLCNGCICKRGTLLSVWTNVVLSITVLSVALFVWFICRCCRKEETPQQLPLTEFMPPMMPRKPTENPTIVINPDHDVSICVPIVESPPVESESEESPESEGISEGDSSDYSSFSDTKSVDPRALEFLYKRSPMLTLADRTWSEEIAGPSEIRPEGYASDMDGRPGSTHIRQRRSKSAFEGSSGKAALEFLDSRKSAKRVAELAPSPKHPLNRHRRRRVRTFRRRNRRGLAGDFVISEPQPSIKLPKKQTQD